MSEAYMAARAATIEQDDPDHDWLPCPNCGEYVRVTDAETECTQCGMSYEDAARKAKTILDETAYIEALTNGAGAVK